ncbi:30S ribosomal protein S16 [Patescibacteria group bacterium]|nr:30S ribosomal protein S16 [Patescibacteria group bacterium]
MLKIRLQRVGRKHDPSFRIVLTDSKNGPKSGNFLEILGNYDAKKDVRKIEGDRVKELVAQGAQVSDTVHNILITEKIIEGKKINVLPKKSPIVNEEKIKAEAEAAEAKVKAEEEARAAAKAAEAEAEAAEKAEEVSANEAEAPVKEETTAEETPEVVEKKTTEEEVPVEEVKEETPVVEEVKKS